MTPRRARKHIPRRRSQSSGYRRPRPRGSGRRLPGGGATPDDCARRRSRRAPRRPLASGTQVGCRSRSRRHESRAAPGRAEAGRAWRGRARACDPENRRSTSSGRGVASRFPRAPGSCAFHTGRAAHRSALPREGHRFAEDLFIDLVERDARAPLKAPHVRTFDVNAARDGTAVRCVRRAPNGRSTPRAGRPCCTGPPDRRSEAKTDFHSRRQP